MGCFSGKQVDSRKETKNGRATKTQWFRIARRDTNRWPQAKIKKKMEKETWNAQDLRKPLNDVHFSNDNSDGGQNKKQEHEEKSV